MTRRAPELASRWKTVIVAVLLSLVFASASSLCAQDSGAVHVLHVQGRVYMISGAGGNVAVQLGDEGVVVVDTGTAAMAKKVLAEIQKLSTKPIEFVINTTLDEDHTGGNGTIAKAGMKLSGADSNKATAFAGQVSSGAAVVGHIDLMNRMVESEGKKGASPKEDWPTDPYEGSSWKIFNDEPIIMYHATGRTDADSYVFFRRSDVVSTGEIFVPFRFPVIDEEKGGSIDGIIDALNTIIDDILVPRENEEGGTYVIPGRGRICDRTEVVDYRDMLTIVRARIADLVKKGKTLQEVKDSRPAIGYEGLYGAQTGPWTTDMFVEAVYRNLTKDKNRK